jgi:hypothetical protein
MPGADEWSDAFPERDRRDPGFGYVRHRAQGRRHALSLLPDPVLAGFLKNAKETVPDFPPFDRGR